MTPEQLARFKIDSLLIAAGWAVQDVVQGNLHAARGVALREFALNPGFGTADYLLYVDGKAAGVIEAKKEGATLTSRHAMRKACSTHFRPGVARCRFHGDET